MASPITTHVLDTSRGRPAADVEVTLSRCVDGVITELGTAMTNADGRVLSGLVEASAFVPGEYQIRFETQRYFRSHGIDAFYPRVTIDFVVAPGEDHYHVPLLLSPFGFSTYRGS